MIGTIIRKVVTVKYERYHTNNKKLSVIKIFPNIINSGTYKTYYLFSEKKKNLLSTFCFDFLFCRIAKVSAIITVIKLTVVTTTITSGDVLLF